MQEYDVTIIGAGLAGLSAASFLSKNKDINILLVEQFKIGEKAGNKIDVVEVENLERHIRKLEVKPHCTTYDSRWHSPSNDQFFLELKNPDCYFLKRGTSEDSIDSQLIKTADKQGVKIILNSKVIDLNSDTRNTTITISTPDGNKKINSKIIIAADGINSNIAKMSGILKNNNVRMVEGYGIEGGKFNNVEKKIPEVFFNTKYAPGGYLFIAPSLDGNATAFCLCDKSKLNNISVKDRFNSFIKKNSILKEIFLKVKIKNELFGTGIISGPLKKTTKDNILLIGNAASVMDPFFAYGVKNAIITAHLASNVVTKSILENEISLLNEYEVLLRKELGKSIRLGFFLRQIYDNLRNKDFDYIISVLNKLKSNGFEFDEIFDEISIKRHVPAITIAALNQPIEAIKIADLSIKSFLKCI